MKNEKETIYGLIVRLAGLGFRFKMNYKEMPLEVSSPEGLDEKQKKKGLEDIKKNKEEIKRYVIIRDLPRHPIAPQDIVDVAKKIFGKSEAEKKKSQEMALIREEERKDYSNVPY